MSRELRALGLRPAAPDSGLRERVLSAAARARRCRTTTEPPVRALGWKLAFAALLAAHLALSWWSQHSADDVWRRIGFDRRTVSFASPLDRPPSGFEP